MKLKWGRIIAVVAVVVAMANWRRVNEALAELNLGAFWSAFCDTLGSIPPFGKYVVVLAVLALIFITAHQLVLRKRREK